MITRPQSLSRTCVSGSSIRSTVRTSPVAILASTGNGSTSNYAVDADLTVMDIPNEDKFEAARNGDPSAFNALFARNMPKLIAFIRARAGGVVGARESAADLAQSVCREVLEELDTFEYRSESAFVSWLYGRAIYKIQNRRRFHHRARRNVDWEVPPDGSTADLLDNYASLATPSRISNAKEELQRIESAIGRLPDGQRDAVAMTRIAGLSYEETASVLGKSESAVRGLVLRGMASLVKWLDDPRDPSETAN